MYRSQDPTNAMPQVAILLSREPSSSNQQHIFSSRIFLLPEGRRLLSERDSTINGFLWRSPWSTLLHTTFGEDLDTLLSGDIGRPFTLFLAALPNLREPDLRYEEQRRVAVLDEIFFMHPMLWSYEQAGSAKFLEFACIRLPELSDCLHSAYYEVDPEQSHTLGSLAMQEIEEACRCSLHVRRAGGQPDHKTCLSTSAKTIGIYLWLYVSDIEADVGPSINELFDLYKWQLTFEDRKERDRHKAAVWTAEIAAQLATRLAKVRGKERGERRELFRQSEVLKKFENSSYDPPTYFFQTGQMDESSFLRPNRRFALEVHLSRELTVISPVRCTIATSHESVKALSSTVALLKIHICHQLRSRNLTPVEAILTTRVLNIQRSMTHLLSILLDSTTSTSRTVLTTLRQWYSW